MIYNTRTQEEWEKAQGYTKGGHTDFGSLTLLFSQHVAGLQIRTPEGDWKYVKHVDGGITCNIADTLSFLTNGEPLTRQGKNSTDSGTRLSEIHNPQGCHPAKRSTRDSSSWIAILLQTWRPYHHEDGALSFT